VVRRLHDEEGGIGAAVEFFEGLGTDTQVLEITVLADSVRQVLGEAAEDVSVPGGESARPESVEREGSDDSGANTEEDGHDVIQARSPLQAALVDDAPHELLARHELRIADDPVGPLENGIPERVVLNQFGVPLEKDEAVARDEPFKAGRTPFLHEAQRHGVRLRKLEEERPDGLECFPEGPRFIEGADSPVSERVLGGSEIR
jgi:hypothetical protein